MLCLNSSIRFSTVEQKSLTRIANVNILFLFPANDNGCTQSRPRFILTSILVIFFVVIIGLLVMLIILAVKLKQFSAVRTKIRQGSVTLRNRIRSSIRNKERNDLDRNSSRSFHNRTVSNLYCILHLKSI